MVLGEKAVQVPAAYRPAVAVDNRMFADEASHRREMDSAFRRCWLFVGLAQQVAEPGDFLTTVMGEDPVILSRDRHGALKVLLNKCLHRGNKVCLFDRGNLKQFTCSYHGWSYDTGGKLTGIPQFNEAYVRALPRTEMHLVEAQVAQYGPLVFASWEPEQSLDDYLGDMKWYLDTFLFLDGLGGLEVVPGRQRQMIPINWKLVAENFAGDHYHFGSTHASFLKVLGEMPTSGLNIVRRETATNTFEVTLGDRHRGVPHSLGQLMISEDFYHADLEVAALLGQDAVDWVKQRRAYVLSRLTGHESKPYSFNRAHIFPNLSIVEATSALGGLAFLSWHPHGVTETLADQWCIIAAGAPDVVKRNAVSGSRRGLSAGGLISPDDWENFARINHNVRTPVASSQPFDYSMGADFEGSLHPKLIELDPHADLPGLLSYHTSEINQREFVRYCTQLREN